MTQNYTSLNQDKNSNQNTSNNQNKTTDINILLNRVRLNQKKTFKKNILVSFLLAGLICSIVIYLII